MVRKMKDPVSGLLHVLGILLSVGALVAMVLRAADGGGVRHIIGVVVFGAGLILLYAASSAYHLLNLDEHKMLVLRKLDHCMIFVLIAATYTPICLVALWGVWGWVLLGIVWVTAVVGSALKISVFRAPRWLYTLCYVVMGWSCLICVVPLVRAVPPAGLLWLLAGGIAYSVGALLYALKWPWRDAKWFGFHEVFHVLILMGSLCHFVVVYHYILPMG